MKYIPNEAWNEFKNRHKSGDLKDLAQGLVTTLIVLVPESQIEAFKKSSKFQDLQTEYYKLVRLHTDVKISKPNEITVYVESKEAFETKYEGSWYNYFS